MNFWAVIGFAAGIAGLAWLGWLSVRNLRQAGHLRRWRHPSLDGLEDRPAALLGEVRVDDPLRVSGMGRCLWYRVVVKVRRGRLSWKESDDEETARFSIVVDGREFLILDPPTEVAGGEALTTHEGIPFFGEMRTYKSRWLPVVDRLTVVGRVRRSTSGWLVVQDPSVGLLYSVHHPAKTALREAVKGWLGLAVAAAGLPALVWLLVICYR